MSSLSQTQSQATTASPPLAVGLSVKGVCGWVGGSPAGEQTLSAMLRALPAGETAPRHVGDRCGLATGDRWQIGRTGSIVVAICGRPKGSFSARRSITPVSAEC